MESKTVWKLLRRGLEFCAVFLVFAVFDVYLLWPLVFFGAGMSAALFWSAIAIVVELVVLGGVASRPLPAKNGGSRV